LQGIQLLQALQGLKLQAGAIEAAVAESVQQEEAGLRHLLASLPSHMLPEELVEQLAALGVYHNNSASAANDFDCSGAEEARGAPQHSDARTQQLLDMASLFADAPDVQHVLEHLEEMVPQPVAPERSSSQRLPLVSRTPEPDLEVDQGEVLHIVLDGEIEVELGSNADGGYATASSPGIGQHSHAEGATPRMYESKTRKLSVLGQLKAQRTQKAHSAAPPMQPKANLDNMTAVVGCRSRRWVPHSAISMWQPHSMDMHCMLSPGMPRAVLVISLVVGHPEKACVQFAWPSVCLPTLCALCCMLGVALQVGAAGNNSDAQQTAVGRIKIAPVITQKLLNETQLDDLYNEAGCVRRQTAAGVLRPAFDAQAAAADDKAAAVAAALGRLPYQQMVASKQMQKAVALVSRQLLVYQEKLYKAAGLGQTQHVFEVAVLVDNSGSMGRFAGEVKQTLVLLAEVLRRIEVQFALVRFGKKHGQLVLKRLGQPFDAASMQLALESLTFDEGTYPATACDFVVREVFKKGTHGSSSSNSSGEEGSAPRVQRHQLILALVDGLTQEMSELVRK
jgi:hypothetical protein